MRDQLPEIVSPVPGPRSRELARRLDAVECPEVTYTGDAPIFWERARGANVWDVDGNRFVDLLAGFGVAALGHADPELARVIADQAAELPSALGDVYPARLKVELLEALAAVLPGGLGHAILSSSGSDAVESALKTALVATGRPGVIAFDGAYHGLSLGALDATHRAHFRRPFQSRLPARTRFAPFGDLQAVRAELARGDVGAVLVEPVQGRGGCRVAPPGFLAGLRELTDAAGALLVADEVYTGLGRTGYWLACEADGVTPDLVALGKTLGGGLPFSACVGRRDVMHAWPPSDGEAVHTSTHLGYPLGCAVALRVLERLRRDELPKRAGELGEHALELLRRELVGAPGVRDVRGRGLMLGVELDDPVRAQAVVTALLGRGWILLPEGARGEVLALTPPLVLDAELLDAALRALVAELRA